MDSSHGVKDRLYAKNISTELAWAHFKNTTLPRRVKENLKGQEYWRKCESGECGGELYEIWGTKLKELGDFGLGIGLFFHMDYILCFAMLLAGIINTYTMAYYMSTDYQPTYPDLSFSLFGSAACYFEQVCTSAECTEDTLGDNTDYCNLNLAQGILDFCTTMMLFLVVYFLGVYQRKMTEKIDMSAQTAQDYSIVVEDPDDDATDPDEWRDFFSDFGHVVYVTVAINNEELLKILSEKRICMYNIEIEAGGRNDEYYRALDTDNEMKRIKELNLWQRFAQNYLGASTDMVYWHQKLAEIHKKVEKLKNLKYRASKVYVIFDSEHSQRKCLSEMTTGLIPATLEKSNHIKDKHKFRGKNVLKIEEPAEPEEINWENQNYKFFYRIKEQSLTFLITVVIVILNAVIIWLTSKFSTSLPAFFISLSNSILPVVVQAITAYEHHPTDSNFQSSLLMKIITFQWMNTAFIIYIIEPQDELLSEGFIAQISSILWADAITSPVLLLLDIPGRLNRYILSHFATNQLKMNSYFIGTSWFLAEKYAGAIKTVFVALFYSAIYPAGLYIASLALFINYWVNKYCLLRLWKNPPPMGDFLALLSKVYLALAVLIKLIVSLNFYSYWLVDNCFEVTNLLVISTDEFVQKKGIQANVDFVYTECEANLSKNSNPWSFTTFDWMTRDQEKLVLIQGISSVVMTVIVAVVIFGVPFVGFVKHLFSGSYKTVGRAHNKKFSEVEEIQAYVPQVEMELLTHPLLATDIGKLKTEHVSWKGNYDHFNLCSEEDLPDMTHEERVKSFSPCVYYPPREYETES
eukprot:CAMPEP_0171462724 /NCGR_PEP_ID=MMETSP0945-20130129/6640_1 /TAXON_ID=109269 /ORGANISM="Vaucheria litorea, Strain CCMP2940" /LENGTH=804 /DNA_ID=CAMNT_0011989293 /DNA_START=60 /DNA_END=2474 /DNA_ORIENTATION=-